MPAFDGLGRSLRWIRQRQGKKQYEVANTAKITKAMLSSYENEKQRPTLETLERILNALGIDLDYLAYAIRAVRHEDFRRAQRESGGKETLPARLPERLPSIADTDIDVQRMLGLAAPLAPPEEQALAQMLYGFHSLLRYIVTQPEDSEAKARPDDEPDLMDQSEDESEP